MFLKPSMNVSLPSIKLFLNVIPETLSKKTIFSDVVLLKIKLLAKFVLMGAKLLSSSFPSPKEIGPELIIVLF